MIRSLVLLFAALGPLADREQELVRRRHEQHGEGRARPAAPDAVADVAGERERFGESGTVVGNQHWLPAQRGRGQQEEREQMRADARHRWAAVRIRERRTVVRPAGGAEGCRV